MTCPSDKLRQTSDLRPRNAKVPVAEPPVSVEGRRRSTAVIVSTETEHGFPGWVGDTSRRA
jgi:hypothetical protein